MSSSLIVYSFLWLWRPWVCVQIWAFSSGVILLLVPLPIVEFSVIKSYTICYKLQQLLIKLLSYNDRMLRYLSLLLVCSWGWPSLTPSFPLPCLFIQRSLVLLLQLTLMYVLSHRAGASWFAVVRPKIRLYFNLLMCYDITSLSILYNLVCMGIHSYIII